MASRPNKPKGLGRGLSSFLADTPAPAPETSTETRPNGYRVLPIEQVHANPDQPRRRFDPEKLEELTASLREKGILQPLLVRSHPRKSDAFEIIAGERRWRAAQQAGLHTVPVIVREMTDSEVLEIALIENVQRADLSALEEAQGLRALLDQFGYTQEQLSKVIGKSRSHIANTLRLLGLPDAVQMMLARGELSAGHARALLTAENPVKVANAVLSQGLSVRQTEALVKGKEGSKGQGGSGSGRTSKGHAKDADTRALEADLSAHLGLAVSVEHTASGAGELRIRYGSLDDLDGLCQLLSR